MQCQQVASHDNNNNTGLLTISEGLLLSMGVFVEISCHALSRYAPCQITSKEHTPFYGVYYFQAAMEAILRGPCME